MICSDSRDWCSVAVLIIVALCTHIISGVSGQLEFRDSPHNATSLLSHRTIFTCSVPDNPPVNIRWTLNGTIITSSDRVNISYNPATGESQLIINELQYTDNGAYQCEAVNSNNVVVMSGIGYITAIGPPVFRTPLEPVSVPVGRVATFTCDVYSNPMLQSVSWMFNGVMIVSDALRIIATDTQLTINSVQSEDEGSYSCVVTNAYGTVQSSAIFTIANIPDLMVTTRPSGSLHIVEGDTATITCTVEGGTPSTLDWYRNGMKLSESDSIGLSHTSPTIVVLTLRNVISSDGGVYMCNATIAGVIMTVDIVVDVLTQPQFTNQPGNFTFDNDESGISISAASCSAMGNPPPTITWYGPNDVPLQVSGSDIFIGMASSSAGEYSCVAINTVGQSVTRFYIFIRGPPVITLPPHIDIGVGFDLSVLCIVQSYPTPTVAWTRLPHFSPNSYVIDNNLTIIGVTFTNGGAYQCIATNECDRVCGTRSKTVIINVHGPPVVSQAPVDKYAVTGDTVTLQCSFTSTLPVNITWTKEDLSSVQIVAIAMSDRITINDSNNTGELIMHSTTSEDSGLYTCTGVTIAGTAVTAAEVLVGESPVFTTYLQNVDLNIGDDITLTCSASGDPLPQISWEKTDKRTGERLMLSGSDIVALSNGNLPLVNVQQDDTGLYHCVASNRVDQIEITAEIRVQGPPLVRSITPTIIVAGDNAVLTCNLIFDFPPPSIQWSRSDGLSTAAGRINVIQNGSLIIVPTDVSDAVVYTCVATNQFGSSSYSVAVTVHFQPIISLEILNYTHFIDDTATLPCPVNSNPPSTFEWRLGMNMAELQGESKYQIDPVDGTLTIRGLRISDTNIYHCIATNYLNNDTAATTITVEGPPPENITVNTSASTSLLVEWNASSVTEMDLLAYQVIFGEEFGDELTNATILDQTNKQNRSITLYGLKPFTKYRIVVRGIYIGIITDSGEVTTSNGINATTTATTAEDFPTVSPQLITTDSDVEYVDIFFEALPEENRNGIIIGYNFYYRPSVQAEYINYTGGVYYDDNGTNFTIINFSLAVYRPGNVNATSYQYTLDGLDDDSSYDVFMEAFNSVGVGPNTTVFTIQTDQAFPTTLVVVITSTVGGLIIITLIVVLVVCCCFYCRKRRKSHEAEADKRTARNVKKLIISEPTTDIPPDTTSSTKFSVESTDGDVIPLNPKVIKSEDRAPSPEPGETALPVKRITFEDEQQSDRPVSGLYSEPADCLSRYHSESAAAKSTEEEMKIVDDAFKDITDKEPLYSSIPESHKKVKREKKKHKDKGKSKQESMHPTIAEDTTLENIDTSTLEGQQMHRMLDAASAGMF